MRKTLEVAVILEKANHFFANSIDEMTAERRGVASFLGTILMEGKRYSGFGYLTENMVGTDYRNGKKLSFGVEYKETSEGKSIPTFHDETRVKYY